MDNTRKNYNRVYLVMVFMDGVLAEKWYWIE